MHSLKLGAVLVHGLTRLPGCEPPLQSALRASGCRKIMHNQFHIAGQIGAFGAVFLLGAVLVETKSREQGSNHGQPEQFRRPPEQFSDQVCQGGSEIA